MLSPGIIDTVISIFGEESIPEIYKSVSDS